MRALRERRRPLAALLTAALLPLLSGCYSYTPLEALPPQAGGEVRLLLNDEGREAVARQAEGISPRRVDGRVLVAGADEITVVTTSVRNRTAAGSRFAGTRADTLRVPVAGIESASREDFQLLPTALLVGAGLVGFFFGFQELFSGPGSPGEMPPNGGELNRSGGGGS